MRERHLLSTYTPSNTPYAILKRIFVQRHKLLERIVGRLAKSMATEDKNHILLVGPRGCGKTNLVTLAVWALQDKSELDDCMRIAWLGEDDTFTGLVHLAFGIASRLAQEYPNEFPADFKNPVRGLSQDDAALSVLHSTIKHLGNRNLLLVTENMDQTFHSLGDTGQKKWRAFLQETRKIATLATAQRLFTGVSSRNDPFFGFFDIQHLEPLSVDQAAELMARISLEQSKPELVEYLKSPEGRFRVRALHYLAGGNHRMYVLLAEFLTKKSLNDLVSALEGLANDLTPFFQERMRSLPDQQRQLVQCLCDAQGAMTVKQIAGETFIEERTCAKQLGNLKSTGYVRSEKRGKESYYDMVEPLMRLCLEAKTQHGRPLRLVARFLRAWFSLTALRKGATETNAGRAVAYDRQGDTLKELADYSAVIDMPDAPVDQEVLARLNRGARYWQDGLFRESAEDYEAVLEIKSVSSLHRTEALFAVVEPMIAYCNQDDLAKALKRAFELGTPATDAYGGTPNDLLAMVLKKSPVEWSSYVSQIASLYIQYGVAEKLGQGVTQSIHLLDEGGFSQSQIDTWNAAWQHAGNDCEDLEIPLRCLNATVEVMKTQPRSDRPLFRLPIEIRQLIRPLLKHSLGEP